MTSDQTRKITPALSRQVGWDKRHVEWPKTIAEIYKASDYQLLVWYRFLPSPENIAQEELIRATYLRVNDPTKKEGPENET